MGYLDDLPVQKTAGEGAWASLVSMLIIVANADVRADGETAGAEQCSYFACFT